MHGIKIKNFNRVYLRVQNSHQIYKTWDICAQLTQNNRRYGWWKQHTSTFKRNIKDCWSSLSDKSWTGLGVTEAQLVNFFKSKILDMAKVCYIKIGNPIVDIRLYYDCLISTMRFPLLVRCHLYIELQPRSQCVVCLALMVPAALGGLPRPASLFGRWYNTR